MLTLPNILISVRLSTFLGLRQELEPVNSARSEQGRVKDVNPVGGHNDLDVLGGLEPVQLIENYSCQ